MQEKLGKKIIAGKQANLKLGSFFSPFYVSQLKRIKNSFAISACKIIIESALVLHQFLLVEKGIYAMKTWIDLQQDIPN